MRGCPGPPYNSRMTHTSHHRALDIDTRMDPGWSAAGLFLDAFARRDFAALSACLDPDVRFRALVPPAAIAAIGAADAAGHFRRWFGGNDSFEIVDASIGQIGNRMYLRWRVRMASVSDPSAARVVEQHAFATLGEHIESLDLLCSGFQTADTASVPRVDDSRMNCSCPTTSSSSAIPADTTDHEEVKP